MMFPGEFLPTISEVDDQENAAAIPDVDLAKALAEEIQPAAEPDPVPFWESPEGAEQSPLFPQKRSAGRPPGAKTLKRRRSSSVPPLPARARNQQRDKYSPSQYMKVSDEPKSHSTLVEKPLAEQYIADDVAREDIRGTRVIMELDQLEQCLGQVPCSDCRNLRYPGHLRLSRDIATGKLTDNPCGLAHEYLMECDKCGNSHHLTTSAKMETAEGVAGRKPFEINRAAVTAGGLSGVRCARQTSMFTMMGVKGLSKDKTWTAHSDEVGYVVDEAHHDQIIENRVRVRSFMVEQGFKPDGHGRIPVIVSADGSWAVRGYMSNCGQASLIFSHPEFGRLVIAQGYRQKTCSTCQWYERHQPTYVQPLHCCRRNFEASSKSMEQDILIELVDEVAVYQYAVQGSQVLAEKPLNERLVVEAVCSDEDSSFWKRITAEGALKNCCAPRKLSDVNHLSNCLMRRLAGQKAKTMKGTTLLSALVCSKFCDQFRNIVKQNTRDHLTAREQIDNMICHYFNDHTNCHKFPRKNEDGTEKQWCRVVIARDNDAENAPPARGPSNFPHNKYLEKTVKVKRGIYVDEVAEDGSVKKKKTGSEDVTVEYFEDVKHVFKVFLSDQVLKAATSGYSSNVNESLHSIQVSQMNGKHTFKGQRSNYWECMQAATLKHSLGMNYVRNVLPSCGLPVTLEMKRFFQQATDKAEKKKLYYKKRTTKTIRKKRKMLRKKQTFEDRKTPDEYGKGMALDTLVVVDTLQDKDDSSDDDSNEDPADAGSIEDFVQCLRCHKTAATEEDPMLFCCNQMTCGQACHEKCASGWSYALPLPKDDEDRDASVDTWPCPHCQYMAMAMSEDPDDELIFEPQELLALPAGN